MSSILLYKHIHAVVSFAEEWIGEYYSCIITVTQLLLVSLIRGKILTFYKVFGECIADWCQGYNQKNIF